VTAATGPALGGLQGIVGGIVGGIAGVMLLIPKFRPAPGSTATGTLW
jgi:hypothetical protein